VVGLYQYLRATLPISIKNIKDGFLTNVFSGPNTPMTLTDSKTFKKIQVPINGKEYDKWMTNEGIEKVCSVFGQENLRHMPVTIAGHYAGLIYINPNGFNYKLFQDIDELPTDRFDKKDVRPISFAELMMLSVYKNSDHTPCFVTRYPITGYGSIYPSYVYLKSTVESETRELLDDNWEPTGEICSEFPIYQKDFFNSMSPAVKHLGRLGADKIE
jgi:hypothetical protein